MILTKVCLIAVMLGWSGLGMFVGLLERDNITPKLFIIYIYMDKRFVESLRHAHDAYNDSKHFQT